MNSDYKLAIEASIEAGKIIMKYYLNEYEIKEKSYQNPVTTADREADSYLKSVLTKARPNYGWLSEETADTSNRLDKEMVWIVDPLDGTKEFIEGIPHFVVSVALVKNGEPIIGVLHNPVTKDIFHAMKGNGTFLNDKVHNCTIKDSTLDMVILNSRSETSKGLWEPYKFQFKELKPIGSVAYKMGLTAVGDADIFATLRPKNEWDICAGTCLINESGGKVIDLNGESLTFNNKKTLIEPGLIAGNQNSVEKTYKIFNER
jgi:myo-inositol-1(or 4)-monophosphatase